MRTLEEALSLFGRPGIGPCLVSEQLGLQQGLAHRSTINLQKSLLPTLGQIVQTRRNQFLARAALAYEQYRLV